MEVPPAEAGSVAGVAAEVLGLGGLQQVGAQAVRVGLPSDFVAAGASRLSRAG